ncbi:putative pentatricopeptide repeat-containing protein At3g13770, mitochondrial [Ricinus communis]|uniref:putative pentatricopeptide repeat-containing protein At3g13770, mitochondrial n=1 Tax=Ricinus communis TaxID=3988 RepID=UPI00201A2B28|nr:putative pentatricopeptide repeat-containing protein At3g13770, mitochondrial [Ricinus communis]
MTFAGTMLSFKLGFSCAKHGIQTTRNILNHVNLRFLSTSMAAALSDTISQPQFHQEATIDPPVTQILKISNPDFSFFMDPNCLISTLLNCKNICQIKQLHALITTNSVLYNNLTVANKLLYVYVHHKCLTDAYALFDEMPQKNPVSWSIMIGGFVKVGEFMQCYKTFKELIRNGVQPDNYTLPFVIKACRDTVALDMGRLIHCVVLKYGLHLDHFVCAALVDMYAKCKVIEDAKLLFDVMPSKDLVTWTVMIGGYAECGNAKESLVLFDHLREEGFVPDKIAMVSIVNACAKLGAMNKARFVHEYVNRNRFSLDVILGTAMIDMYAKCGDVDSAREIFDNMHHKNVISWSAMIAAYGYHGQGKKALELFPMMLSSGILPNNITFVSLLYACSHAGLVEDGLTLFSLMWESFGVRPDIKHHTCMVDLLGRAGQLTEAFRFIENMTVEKDEGLWSSLLGACRIHKRIDLAEKAAKSLLELQPQNPGNYILLSNIYANAGQWKDVAKIRDLMTKRKLKKIPGYTWIEVYDIIYQFNVGDSTHPRSMEINGMLKTLSQKLELAGYVPDTNFVLHDVDDEVKLGMLYTHSEKLAIAFALIATPEGTPIRMSKNLRVCGDCHTFSKLVSDITQREIIVRDSNRFHHFKEGACSCGDYW